GNRPINGIIRPAIVGVVLIAAVTGAGFAIKAWLKSRSTITTTDNHHPPPPQRKIFVPIRAADTNLTLELVTENVVGVVKVRVNSGVEQELKNRDMEATTLKLDPVTTPEDLYEVITQVDNDPPVVHRFPKY